LPVVHPIAAPGRTVLTSDRTVFSPSIVLGRDVRIGAMATDSIVDDGLAGFIVRINMQQGNYSFPCDPDNWDIYSLNVSLVAPSLVVNPLCQLNLVGTSQLQDGSLGLVRLSETQGSSGNGPSSPIYNTGAGSGCP